MVCKFLLVLKPGCHLLKYVCKCAGIYTLARALVMLEENLGIFPTVELVRKYTRIYACIHASGILA
jgi:hypothetical protein